VFVDRALAWEQLQAQQQALHECGHVSSDLIFWKGCPLSLSSADSPLLNFLWLPDCISILEIFEFEVAVRTYTTCKNVLLWQSPWNCRES